jgi:hypothetical protein
MTPEDVARGSAHSAQCPSTETRTEASRVYGAELDGTACPACVALAGLEYADGDRQAPAIPNPACTHPSGCRCGWL